MRQAGSFSWAHIEPKRLVGLSINLGPSDAYTSAGMESDPGAFPLEMGLMAFVTSSSERGQSLCLQLVFGAVSRWPHR